MTEAKTPPYDAGPFRQASYARKSDTSCVAGKGRSPFGQQEHPIPVAYLVHAVENCLAARNLQIGRRDRIVLMRDR